MTSSGCARRPGAHQTGRLSPLQACRWGIAYGSEAGGPVGQGGEGIHFFGAKSRRGGGSNRSWGLGGESGCKFWSSPGPSKGSTPTGGPGMGRGRRWERHWSASSNKGGGGEDNLVARVQETGGGAAQAHGGPDANDHALGLEDPKGCAHVHGSPPPQDGSSSVWGRSHGLCGGGGADRKVPCHRVKGGALARWARAGRAQGIFFDPCPTSDLLGGALQLFGRLAVLEPHTLSYYRHYSCLTTGILMLSSHVGYGIFGFSPSFTNFLPFFARFHHIHSLLG